MRSIKKRKRKVEKMEKRKRRRRSIGIIKGNTKKYPKEKEKRKGKE